ncbi:MAG: cupredoxin domain-containing protein [Gemmatimonadota bacterium]
MRYTLSIGLSVLVFASAAVACGQDRAAPANSAKRHTIEIRGFAFAPARIRVAPGDTVVWVNRDVVPHTATATGAKWDSGDIPAGKSAIVIARGSGEQPYICAYHPSMRGTLIVAKRP